MSLEPDALVERRRLRRRLRLWQVFAVVLALGVVAAWLGSDRLLFQRDHIARLHVEGVILEDADRSALLAALAHDRAAKALIVHINSPGGTVVGGEDLYNALRAVAAQKPVVAVMGTLATSAGYMASVAGDRVFARETTLTGSIGVVLQATEITGLLNSLGITTEAIKSRPLKATPSPLEPLSDEGRAVLRTVILDSFEFFVDLVAERRPLNRAEVTTLADGRIYTGRQAVANKLVDEIGGERAALAWLRRDRGIAAELPVRTVGADDRAGALARLLGHLPGKLLFSNGLALDGLVSVWQPPMR